MTWGTANCAKWYLEALQVLRNLEFNLFVKKAETEKQDKEKKLSKKDSINLEKLEKKVEKLQKKLSVTEFEST